MVDAKKREEEGGRRKSKEGEPSPKRWSVRGTSRAALALLRGAFGAIAQGATAGSELSFFGTGRLQEKLPLLHEACACILGGARVELVERESFFLLPMNDIFPAKINK